MAQTKPVMHSILKEVPPNKNDPRFKIKTSQQVASACGGALITSLFMTPLDVVKTRLQAQQKAFISNKCFLYCNGLMEHLCPCAPSPEMISQKSAMHLNGTLDGIIKISRYEGITALWSGLSPTLILALPATVIYFVAYEKFKGHYCDLYSQKISDISSECTVPLIVPLTAGISARVLAVSIVSPLELVRTKMQSERLSYLRLYEALKVVVSSQGITGLWRGLTSTIFRDVPFSGIYWSCYETLKSTFNVKDPTFAFSFFAGATSGTIAATVTTPFDVVKTHQQIEFGEKVIYTDKPAKNVPSESTMSALKRIYVSHGVKGLYAGLGPRLAKVAPACAIMIGIFEYAKSFFYQQNIKQYLRDNNMNETLSYEKSE